MYNKKRFDKKPKRSFYGMKRSPFAHSYSGVRTPKKCYSIIVVRALRLPIHGPFVYYLC